MGTGASRELELAKVQATRLSSELTRVTSALAARESALSALQVEVKQMKGDKDLLVQSRRELETTSAELRKVRRVAHDVPSMSAELKRAQEREVERVAELQASRNQLEETVGKLKFAKQEQKSLLQKMTEQTMSEEQKQLKAAQEEAALVSAQAVAEVSCAFLFLE